MYAHAPNASLDPSVNITSEGLPIAVSSLIHLAKDISKDSAPTNP